MSADLYSEATMRAVGAVALERQRQLTGEGYTPERDDRYRAGALESAAACYAFGASLPDKEREQFAKIGELDFISQTMSMARRLWPAGWQWPKLKTRRHDLVRAGALIIAAIERLDREAEATTRKQLDEFVGRMVVTVTTPPALVLDAYDAAIAGELGEGISALRDAAYRKALAGKPLDDVEVRLCTLAHPSFSELLPPLWPTMFTPRGVRFFPSMSNTYTLDRDIAGAIALRIERQTGIAGEIVRVSQ